MDDKSTNVRSYLNADSKWLHIIITVVIFDHVTLPTADDQRSITACQKTKKKKKIEKKTFMNESNTQYLNLFFQKSILLKNQKNLIFVSFHFPHSGWNTPIENQHSRQQFRLFIIPQIHV